MEDEHLVSEDCARIEGVKMATWLLVGAMIRSAKVDLQEFREAFDAIYDRANVDSFHPDAADPIADTRKLVHMLADDGEVFGDDPDSEKRMFTMIRGGLDDKT